MPEIRSVTGPAVALADGRAPADMPPARRRWTLALAGLGAFMSALDVVVVATALPTMRTQLGASLADLEWTINAYNLALGCLMLTGAALGDRFGRRRMYVLGLVVFTAGSVLAALSPGAGLLIAARVVQGAGGAVLVPLTLTLISDAFGVEKRGAAIGIWGGITGLGVAAGPVVGGAVVQGISWQWIFWLNVPVGLVVAALSASRLRESRGPRPQLDIAGLVLAGAGLFALTWAAVRAPAVGWASAEVTGALAAGVILMLGFVAWERRARYPMLPLAYFRRRGFATANGVIFFQFISLIGSLFFITQLFQVGLGYSPLGAGLRILVWMAMPMLVAPVAGALADRVGNRPFMFSGLALQAAGLGWLAAVARPGVGYGTLVAPLIVAGVGIAMCFPTVANAVTASVPDGDVGVAAGTNNALNALGGVFGVAILAAVFAARGSYASPAAFIDGFRPAEWTVARDGGPLADLQARLSGSVTPVSADAADLVVAGQFIDAHRPGILVLNAGAAPLPRPLQHQTWQTFSRNWEVDVQHVFHWTREALLAPLNPGSLVITMSSGAAPRGSPLSGGYAGAKATVRFITSYAAEESARAGLAIRFISVLPQLTPETTLGAPGVAAYASRAGLDTAAFVRQLGPVLTPEQADHSVLELVTITSQDAGAFLLTGSGLTPVTD